MNAHPSSTSSSPPQLRIADVNASEFEPLVTRQCALAKLDPEQGIAPTRSPPSYSSAKIVHSAPSPLHHQGTGETLELASVNRYLRRLQHEQLRSLVIDKGDNPGFYSQNLKDEYGQTVIVLTRATAEEVGLWKAEDAARKAEAITDAAGEPITRLRCPYRPGSTQARNDDCIT